jgi:hypothetical protein
MPALASQDQLNADAIDDSYKRPNKPINAIANRIPRIIPHTTLAAVFTGFRTRLPQCGQACASVLTSLPQSGHGLIIARDYGHFRYYPAMTK